MLHYENFKSVSAISLSSDISFLSRNKHVFNTARRSCEPCISFLNKGMNLHPCFLIFKYGEEGEVY